MKYEVGDILCYLANNRLIVITKKVKHSLATDGYDYTFRRLDSISEDGCYSIHFDLFCKKLGKLGPTAKILFS